MRAIASKDLGKRLRELVRLASQGETTLILDGDIVVAELRPPTSSRDAGEGFLADLVRRGLMTPATLQDGGPPPSLPVKGARASDIAAEVAGDREER